MLLISCNKDETYLMDYLDGRPAATTQANASNEVEAVFVSTCECEYKIHSITDVSPSLGNHVEMQAWTYQDNCSAGCPWALAYFGPCWANFWFGNSCGTDLGSGSISFTFPTRWIPFNCSIPEGDTFNKRLYLSQNNSSCNSSSNLAGKISYGIRCRGACSAEWEYNTDNLFTFSGSGVAYLEFEVALQEGSGGCECSPNLDY